MNGGDLRFHITRKTFTEEAVRFWIAELACALRYTHQQGIVHRDVKPDNVLLDLDGHVHLADFNVASDLTPGKQLTSKSGTLAYLAPEVYAGKGYGSAVDWWSLGVLFYECIYNKRPFEASNHKALADSIIKANPRFPLTSPAVSMPCLHAISSLLERDKSLRIGAASFGTFTDNPFFREIDFEALEAKEITPVFCPSSEKTNFDATYDLEELLLEEAPLEARARKQKPRAELREDATQQEIRADELHKMIETMFEPFNYEILPPEQSEAAIATLPSTTVNQSPTHHYARSDHDTPMETPYARPHNRPHPRSTPISRSQTPLGTSRTQSSTHSNDGSPPLLAAALAHASPGVMTPIHHQSSGEYFPDAPSSSGPTSHPRPVLMQKLSALRFDSNNMPPSGNNTMTASSRSHRYKHSARSASIGSGVSLVTNAPSTWEDMATQGQAKVASPGEERRSERPTGMLGFLSRRKGRDRSPRGKERERGVLGKEGARVVISHG